MYKYCICVYLEFFLGVGGLMGNFFCLFYVGFMFCIFDNFIMNLRNLIVWGGKICLVFVYLILRKDGFLLGVVYLDFFFKLLMCVSVDMVVVIYYGRLRKEWIFM